MKRTIRSVIFLIVGLFIGGYSAYSNAETYTATGIYYYPSIATTSQYGSQPDACAPLLTTLTSTPANYNFTTVVQRQAPTSSSPQAWNCIWTHTTNGTQINSNVTTNRFIAKDFTCPAGATKNYLNVTCNVPTACTAPNVRNPATGACDPPPPTCNAGSTSYAGYGETRSFSLAGTEMATQACFNGCTINISGSPIGVGIKQPDGSFITTTSGTVGSQTGASCTGTTGSTTTAAEDDCLNQGKSFIAASGSTTCVTPGTANSPPITKKTVTSGTNTTSSGTTTTNTTTNTTVNNNTVTTTNTTITTNPDGSTSTSVNSTNQPLNTYCQSNPSASLCTGGAFSNGTAGNGSSSCTGCATESTATAIKDKLTVDGSGSGDAAAGYPSVPDSFYTATYQNGLQGVWGDFKTQVNSTQFVSGINGFVPSGWDSGTAPSWNIDFSGLHAGWGSIEVSPASNIWFFIKIVFVVTTLFLCRTIIFGG